MKKEVLIVLLLIFIPLVFSQTIVDQCFGDCPAKDTFEDFTKNFDSYKNRVLSQTLPEGLNALIGNQNINVKVNDYTFSLEIKNNNIIEMNQKSFDTPTLTASMDDTTFTSIMQSKSPQDSVKQAIYENRIALEGNNLIDKLRSLGSKAYSFFTSEGAMVELDPVPCLEAEDSDQTIKLKRAGEIKIPENTELIIYPFKTECERNTELKLTLSIPKNYRDVQVLKCNNDLCLPSYVEEVEKLSCGEDLVKIYKEKDETFLTPINIPLKEQKIITNSVLESGSVKIEVLNSEPVLMSVSAAKSFPKISNPSLKVLGTPLVIDTDKKTPVQFKLTMPYLTGLNIDPDSVSIYAFQNNNWNFIGGTINLGHEKISVDINDLSKFLDKNNQALFALIGWICENCDQSSLMKIYDPYTDHREGVVFVHGLGFSPESFKEIIDDIRLTHQPWQVFNFDYSTNEKLNNIMIDLTNSLEDKTTKLDRLHLIGHDLGGILLQHSLNYAKTVGNYDFLSKVQNVILIGSPNKGLLDVDQTKLLEKTINSKIPVFFDLNNELLKDLKEIPQIKGINYKIIAGIKPYDFSNALGDGLVSKESAQLTGINKLCNNYWEVQASHEELLNNFETKEVVEKIIAEDLDVKDKAIIGNQKYYELQLDDCSDEKIAVVGKKDLRERTPQVCSCGNGYCGWDEDKQTCSTDCSNIFRKEIYCSQELMQTLLVCLILLLFSTFLVDTFTRKVNKRKKSFIIITSLTSLIMLALVLINFLCEFQSISFTLEILVFLILVRKLYNLVKNPFKKI